MRLTTRSQHLRALFQGSQEALDEACAERVHHPSHNRDSDTTIIAACGGARVVMAAGVSGAGQQLCRQH